MGENDKTTEVKTWQDLADFINTLSPAQLQEPIKVNTPSEGVYRCTEFAAIASETIYKMPPEYEDAHCGTLEELRQYYRTNWQPEDMEVIMPEGAPFLYIE